eukprot:Em0010g132a
MFRQRAAEVACFAFIAAVGVQLVASQTLTCYTSSTTCTSTSVSLNGTRPAGQCCLKQRREVLQIYGFFQFLNSTVPSTTVYQKEGSQLTGYFGFVNGTFSGTHSVSFSVPDNNRYIKSFTTGVLNSAAARQQFTLNIIPDNIALQPPLMVPVSALVDGSSEFVLPFNATILDADVVTIGFRESDYSVTEGASPPDQYPKVKLAKDKTIAQRLSIQVVPLTVDQFRPLGIPLPDGITFADLTNPAQYIPNGPMDFNKSILNLTFTSSQNELSPNVGIVDDLINEGRTAVHLHMAIVGFVDGGAVVTEGGDFIECVAVTDPPPELTMRLSFYIHVLLVPDTAALTIGFDPPQYTVNKSDSYVTFGVSILGGAAIQGASVGVMFSTRNGTAFGVTIGFDQTGYSFLENQRYARVSVRVLQGQLKKSVAVQFRTIRGSAVGVIIGFEKQSYQISKHQNQGRLPVKIQLVFIFIKISDKCYFLASTNYISIDSDLPALNFSVRELTVDVYIIVNDLAEDDKVFSVELFLISPSSRVTIAPISAQVTIIDDNSVIFGFEQLSYSISESNTYVTLKAKVLQGMLGRPVTLHLSTTDVSATDGPQIRFQVPYKRVFLGRTGTASAVDYTPFNNYPLVFGQSVAEATLNVPIVMDNLVEYNETFRATLSLAIPNHLFSITPSSAIVTIVDDDTANCGFNETFYDVYVTDRIVQIQISVTSGVLGRPVQLLFATRQESAIGITIGFSTNQYTTPEGSTLQIQVAAQSNAVLLGRPVSVSIRSSDITALASKNYVSVGPLALTFTRDNLVNSVNLTTIDNNISSLHLQLDVKITDIDNVAVGPIGPANGGQTVTAEGTNATVCFGITRGNLAKDVSINVRTVDGSAVGKSVELSKDYTSINIQMAFNVSGSPNPCVVVPLINTTVYKNPTNFTVVITTTDNNLILDTDTVTVVIDNNAELTIGWRGLCRQKWSGAAVLTITTSVMFNVTISDDARVEDTVETFTALLATSAPRVTVQPNVATVIIKDDDYVNITSVDSVLAEEDEAIIDLQLVGVLGKNVTVVLYTVDQTATAPNNYHLTNVTLTFVPNGPTQQSIYIDIVNDMVSRDPLSFVAMVISTDPAVRIVSPRILVTIPNNNTVTIGFTRPLYTVGERDGSVTLCAAVTNGILGRHVSVTMATSDGTALAGSDYQSSTAVLQFGVGETTSCVNVSIVNDQSLETQETFSATLTTGDSRVILNRSTTSVNIVDDDTVTVSFVSPAYYYYTTNTTGYVVVQKTGTSAIPVVVTVTAPSSAQPNPSVGVISSTITFLPGGNAVQNIPFTITDHGIALRSVETHSVALSNPSQGVVLGQPNQTSVVIMDTNMVMVQFEKSTYSVYENNTTGLSVCVVKDKVTAVPVAVTIVSTPITAVEGTNYVSVRTTITMATTSTRQCFTVAVLDNHVALDPDLTFALSLTATPTSVVASTLRSTVTILDSNDGQDFTGGAFVLVFDASPKNTKCVTIVTLPDQIVELPETFEAKLLPASDYLVGNPGTSSVTITEALNVIMANDTVVGDPLFSVPIYIPLSHLFGSIQPALCYEVHGQENVYFNLISDGGVSVNARYLKVNNYLNVIDQVGIRAVDSRGSVLNIRVDLAGCASYINSTATSLYQADGILLRKYSDRVRVSVPNCGRNSVQLVMWVVCQNNELTDPVTGSTVTAAMIKFVVARGLNLSPQSHGIIGQFWNVPVNVSSYTGPLRNGSSNAYPRYTIAVAHPLSPARRFTGILYSYTWEFDEGMCLYVGNRQAGPIYEVESPNDPVIEGAYTDYIMNDAFATDFAYSRFSPKCSL